MHVNRLERSCDMAVFENLIKDLMVVKPGNRDLPQSMKIHPVRKVVAWSWWPLTLVWLFSCAFVTEHIVLKVSGVSQAPVFFLTCVVSMERSSCTILRVCGQFTLMRCYHALWDTEGVHHFHLGPLFVCILSSSCPCFLLPSFHLCTFLVSGTILQNLGLSASYLVHMTS